MKTPMKLEEHTFCKCIPKKSHGIKKNCKILQKSQNKKQKKLEKCTVHVFLPPWNLFPMWNLERLLGMSVFQTPPQRASHVQQDTYRKEAHHQTPLDSCISLKRYPAEKNPWRFPSTDPKKWPNFWGSNCCIHPGMPKDFAIFRGQVIEQHKR